MFFAARASAIVSLAVVVACVGNVESPEIGGLRLGMAMSDAMQAAEDLYRRLEGDAFRPVVWIHWNSFSVHTNRPQTYDLTLTRDDEGVWFICVNPGLAARLYDAVNVAPPQFAERVASFHQLPALTPRADTNPPQAVPYWEYVSRQGWKVVVDHEKNVILQQWRRAPANAR
jgi:hypothetical protein